MIVEGQKLPEMTMEQIDEANAQHAKEHADCTKEEVLTLLKQNGAAFSDYVSELTDEELDRAAHLNLIGCNISTEQFIENVIMKSGEEHLANMKTATGK
jgi:hypothetical protein